MEGSSDKTTRLVTRFDHYFFKNPLDRGKFISCPICRGDFSKLSDLNNEIMVCDKSFIGNSKEFSEEDLLLRLDSRKIDHVLHELTCFACGCSPVLGRIYSTYAPGKYSKIDGSERIFCRKCSTKCSEDLRILYWKEVRI